MTPDRKAIHPQASFPVARRVSHGARVAERAGRCSAETETVDNNDHGVAEHDDHGARRLRGGAVLVAAPVRQPVSL